MNTIVRAVSAAIASVVGLAAVLVLLVAVLSGSTIGIWPSIQLMLGIFAVMGGFVAVSDPLLMRCLMNQEVDAVCYPVLDETIPQIQAASTWTIIYVVILVATSLVTYFGASRLEKSQVRNLVVKKLQSRDDTFVAQNLGIQGFDRSNVGMSPEGIPYADDILLMESTQGRGDAQETVRSSAQIHAGVQNQKDKVSRRERFLAQMAVPQTATFGGGIKVVLLAGMITVFFTFVILAALGKHPILTGILALVVGYFLFFYDSRWKRIYGLFGANDLYLFLALLSSFLVGFSLFAFLWLLGVMEVGIADLPYWMGYASVPFMVGLGVATLVPLASYTLFRFRENNEANRVIADLYEKLAQSNVQGTHVFARCTSCETTNILLLGRSVDCVACDRVVDSSTTLRTLNV